MNSITDNKPFEETFDITVLPVDKQHEKVYMYEWFKIEGDWVDEGQPLYRIRVGQFIDSYRCYTSQPLTAKQSGVVQICKQKNSTILNGDVIYILHPKGTFLKENSPSNPTYSYYFDKFKYEIPDQYSKHNLRMKKWLKLDGEFVKKGELIFILGYHTSYNNNETLNHYAEKDGFLDIEESYFSYSFDLKQNTLIYLIHDKIEDAIKRKFINIPVIEVDDFTQKKIIRWKKVGSTQWFGNGITSLSIEKTTKLTFSFNNEDDKDFIVFQFLSKELMLSKNDIISFLFDDGRIIDFVLNLNSYKILTSGSEKLFENKILITDSELEHFEQFNFSKWKIIIKKQSREIIGGGEGIYNYERKSNLITVIKKFTKEYRELVRSEIPNYVPLLERNNLQSEIQSSDTEECYVYLMIDTNNHFHKIGISNKPEWREKTLQSEKPTIELIAYKKFISRKIASSFEKALHESYSSKRIRGEWFQLGTKDLNEIKITLNS